MSTLACARIPVSHEPSYVTSWAVSLPQLLGALRAVIWLSCTVLLGVRRVDLEGGLADAVRCPRGRGCGGVLPHSAHNLVQVQGHAKRRRASALRTGASQSGHEPLITGGRGKGEGMFMSFMAVVV